MPVAEVVVDTPVAGRRVVVIANRYFSFKSQ
jgi:hypothetical protein